MYIFKIGKTIEGKKLRISGFRNVSNKFELINDKICY